MPGLRRLTRYQRDWLAPDLTAGLALAALVVPLGMAYAPLAGLEPISGLYASLLALLAYVIFGPSRILVLGPDSSTAPLVAAVIVPMAATDMAQRASLAAMLALLVGAMALVAGIGRLGFITDLIAKPVRVGYMNGVAVVIVVSQLARLFGFSANGDSVLARLGAFASDIEQVVTLALAFGLVSLGAVLLGRYLMPKVPTVLAVVALATVASSLIGAAEAGVPTVGVLPTGLPSFRWPSISPDEMLALVTGALGIAVITLTDSTVLSQSIGGRLGYRPDADREFIAVGAANLAAGLFQGFPVSGSVTRSAVNISTGARTQLAGAIAALPLVIMLVWVPGLLSALPLSVLAAVVIAAGIALTDVKSTVRLWYQRRTEFALSIAAFVAVLTLGVLVGVFVAITLSLLNFVRRQWRPHDAVLGRATGVKGYHDTADFTDAVQVPGLLLYRFDAPLFFANARVFRERLYAKIDEAPDVRRVVLAAEPLIDVDTTAADTLTEIIRDLKEQGIDFGLAELKHPVRERLERYGIIRLVGEDMLYPTIGQAVHAYVRDTKVDWVDWEDEPDSEPPADADAS